MRFFIIGRKFFKVCSNKRILTNEDKAFQVAILQDFLEAQAINRSLFQGKGFRHKEITKKQRRQEKAPRGD